MANPKINISWEIDRVEYCCDTYHTTLEITPEFVERAAKELNLTAADINETMLEQYIGDLNPWDLDLEPSNTNYYDSDTRDTEQTIEGDVAAVAKTAVQAWLDAKQEERIAHDGALVESMLERRRT